MPVQEFLSSATWNWPENIVHATALVLSQGGGGSVSLNGGGGAGGILVAKEIWKASPGATSLTITISNAGGTPNNNGADSQITQGATVEARAAGGKGANGPSGASNTGRDALCVYEIVQLGGSGGDGGHIAGGGGGSAPPVNFTTGFPGIIPPEWNGHQGYPDGDGQGGTNNIPGGDGSGGDGGINGHNYGGGGGGGGGKGGVARVVLLWGQKLGATLFSVGKCCSICDLAKKFPDTVTLEIDFVPTSDPGFDPVSVTCPDIDFGVLIADSPIDPSTCAGHDEFFHADGQTVDSKEQSNAIVPLLNSFNGHELQRISFNSDVGSVVTDAGIVQAWFCTADYACPLAPTIDEGAASGSPLLSISDRWCFLGEHPAGENDSPSITGATNVPPDSVCGNGTFYYWKRFGQVWARVSATVTVWVTAAEKWYSEGTVQNMQIIAKETNGISANGDNLPSDDNWGYDNVPASAPRDASSGVLGPFDTPDEAMSAVKDWTSNIGPIQGEYNPAAANTCGSLYDISTITETYCATSPSGFDLCVFDSASAGYASVPKIIDWYCSTVNVGLQW